MEKEEQFPDSDLDELPELFTKHTFEVEKVTKGDIVWALYKGLYWPALVRDVNKKNKKVNVWYLDSPGKCFKVSFKNIHDFFDGNFTKKVEDDAKLHPFCKKHADVLRKANIYVYRRFRGIKDNPLEFFDASVPYFLLHDVNPIMSEIKINTDIASTKKVSEENDTLEDVEVESVNENGDENCTTKSWSEFHEEKSPYDDEMIDKIISCITLGHIDNYLVDIVNSEVTNERHTSYLEAAKENKVELFLVSQPSIPISSPKLHNASIYLNSLYKKMFGNRNPKMNEYIVCVWLPEAVNKAISYIEAEVSNMDVDLGNDSISKKSSELLVDSNVANISSYKVEACESLVDANSSNACYTPKRKLHLRSSLVTNYNSDILKIGCASNKKVTGRKRQKTQSKALKSGKKVIRKINRPSDKTLLKDIGLS